MRLEMILLYAAQYCDGRSFDRDLAKKARSEFRAGAHHLHQLRKLAIEREIFLGSRDPKVAKEIA
jgi:hypothetical protein